MGSLVQTLEEALKSGVTPNILRGRLERGEWHRLFQGVYLASPLPPSFEQWCEGALIAAGEGACLWGATAARLHGLDGFKPAPGREATHSLPIEVAIPAARRVRRQQNLSLHRAKRFDLTDLVTVADLETTTAIRALIEASVDAPWRNIVCGFEHLHRDGEHEALAKRVAVLRNGRGWLAKLEELMARRGLDAIPTESAAEAICDDILWRGGLRAARQIKVRHGATERRIDLGFPTLKLGIECDSKQWHTAKDAFESDRKRWTWLAARGWQLVNFTWAQLMDEAYVLRAVREAVQARSTQRVG